MRHAFVRVGIVAALAAIVAGLAVAGAARAADEDGPNGNRDVVRFSTFNASLNRNAAGQLIEHLTTPDNDQAKVIAEIVQRNRPDVLLVNEFDFDPMGTALRLFQENYLSVGQNGAQPIVYPYRFAAESNTGIPSGFDLDNNGSVGGPNDAFGFGEFPGSLPWPCTRGTRSARTRSAPSRSSCGRTCREHSCPTTRRHRRPQTGTRRRSSPSSGSRRRATGTSRSGSAAGPSTS